MISFQKKKIGLIQRYPIVGGRRLSNYWWSFLIFFGGCGFLLTGVSSYYNKDLLLLISEIEQPLNIVFILVNKWINFLQSLTKPLAIVGTDLLSKVKNSYFFDDKLFQNTATLLSPQGVNSNSVGPPQYLKIASNLGLQNTSIPFFPQGLVLSFYGFLGLCFTFHLWFTLFWKIGGGFNEFNGKERYVRIFRWGRPGKNRRIDLKYTNELIESIKVEFVPRPALFLRIKGDKVIPLTRLGEFIPLEELEAQAAELTSLLQIPLEITN